MDRTRTNTGIPDATDDYAPKRTKWNLDVDRIIRKLRTNQTFKVGTDFDVTGLPHFADLERYNIPEEKRLELCSLEIHRLVDVVNSAKPIQLEGDAEWFGSADKDGYTQLDKLARQMKLAICICIADFELQMLEYRPILSRTERFRDMRVHLLEQFGPDNSKGPAETWSDMKLQRFNEEAFHALTDYVTGTMTQVLLRTMNGTFWDDNCIITMAKCAAQIKVVAMDLVNSAETCLAGKREWMLRLKRATDKEPDPPPAEEEKTAIGNQLRAMARCVIPRAERYFDVMRAFGDILFLIYKIALGLGSDQAAALPPSVFESSSIVYDTGFGFRSLLCQERHGAIGVSGNRDEVHCASFAFEVCLNVFEELEQRRGPWTKRNSEPTKPSTLVYWKWTEMRSEKEALELGKDIFKGKARTQQLELSSMQHVITAFVPYLMVCGPFMRWLEALTQSVMSISDPGDPVAMCIETLFLAAFMIQTSEYDRIKTAFAKDPNTTSVSASPIVKERALAEGPTWSSPRDRPLSDKKLREEFLERNKDIKAGMDMMSDWIFDTDSIIIQSPWYCWGTLTCCAVLVAGGLAIGLTLNKRIDGVDPFNISIFCWALAGFIIIFMKSRRVENWPWRDFFHGRVVCRSVSEVTAVSGIHDQLFLSILLWEEPRVGMNKQGPFRVIFERNDPDAAGFAIDLPFKTTSLVNAGVFFIKVQSSTGPALVSIRACLGRDYNVVSPQNGTQGGSTIICRGRDFRDTKKYGKGEDSLEIYTLSTNAIHWSRVAGIFWKEASFN